MHILIAPNAFKNSLTAGEASEAILHGLTESGLHCSTRSFPIGDGGDGTASLIIQNLNGVFFKTEAYDPLGRKIKTSFGLVDNGKTAVIEMSDISGLKLLQDHERNPLRTTSFGTGELIHIALDKGVRKIILGIGGSATVDGGCGILQALGVRFLDQFKKELNPLPENLDRLEEIDLSRLDKRMLNIELIILCDVDNLLLGEKGAAVVFGPQKGASDQDVVLLEKSLRKLRDVTFLQTGKDMNAYRHGGAAGGTAAALHIFCNAILAPGIEYFLDLFGFDEALQKADLLITGEGSIDLQTLEGKAPFGVASRARKKNIPVIGLAGKIPLDMHSRLSEYFDVLIAIGHQPEDAESALKHADVSLRNTACQIGKLLTIGSIPTS
jgi:glycerate 2-kinase